MESGCSYHDLIKEYQILLENEKRRLNPVTEKCHINTKDEEETSSKTIESHASQDESHKIDNDVESWETSESFVNKQQGVELDNSKETKYDTHKQAKMMEQWATDSFYTSFPSFKKQDLNMNTLANDRREEYKKYLAEVSNKKLLDAVRSSSRRTEVSSDSEQMFSQPPEKMKVTARDKLLNDLKHSDLAYNFHNPHAIDDRNQKAAMERARKKVELQQELMRQIEEKKLQIEKLRAKEKEEEEILQRRLENQMKALQMADELTKRNSEKKLISNPIDQIPRIRDPVSRKEVESYINHYQSDDASPENRLRNEAINDRQIYKFFSNSAPHNDSHVNYYNNPIGFNHMPIVDPHSHHISTAIHSPTQQHCNRCRRAIPILCSSCCHNDLNPSYYCCHRCKLLQNMDTCNNCRRAWVQSWNHHADIQHRDNRPQILEITYQDHGSQTNRSTSPPKTDKYQSLRSNSLDINRNSLSTQTQTDSPVTHSDKIVGIGSILSDVPETVPLSKEDEMLELKRKNDILISKYARNYGSLRKRKTVAMKETNSSKLTEDPFPLPLMREHFTMSSRGGGVETKRENSQAVKRMEYKWEIPVVQKQVFTNKPEKVLTQVGAIAKQLQLEKLNFGND